MNILLITLDQFRGDSLGCAGHPLVKTPNLDRLAREGVRLARHYSQSAPCSPGRASLYTGMYQMNHRVVANGTPLDARFDNIALAARRAGYTPTLFGYTDQSVDPRGVAPDDPRLQTYEEILPGFEVGERLAAGAPASWTNWLQAKGYAIPDHPDDVLASEPERPAEHSMAAYLTDRFLEWHAAQTRPWFAHLSHFRPHPPYAAAGHFSRMYDPVDVSMPIPRPETPERYHRALLNLPIMTAPVDQAGLRRMRAQYYGMISEADFQLGRVWAALEARGEWQDTFIVVTSDHGEQLGDHGLQQKAGYFDGSYHILGLVRDPQATARGAVVDQYTENVDLFPTLCAATGVAVPAQCDGHALTPFFRGEKPENWRSAAHWEFDWRYIFVPSTDFSTPRARDLDNQNLAVLRRDDGAYVHFGDGRHLAFDLAADPTWRTPLTDPARVLSLAQEMLTWRARHLDRTLTGTLIDKGVVGRKP
jgi:arylsulfatase A-like enzyme